MHRRAFLARLHLGQDVRGGAGYHHHLDAMDTFEGREHVLRVGALHVAPVHADVERLLLGLHAARGGKRRSEQGQMQECVAGGLHGESFQAG